MEEIKVKEFADKRDQEILYSQVVKAGKRIYYIDVKRSRKGDFFIAITESKKITTGSIENPQVSFEKHKIFLYKEDFEGFLEGLTATLQFIKENALSTPTPETSLSPSDIDNVEIKIDDFES